MLAGCASVPHVSPQLTQATPTTIGLDAAARAQVSDTWWTAFGDPQLDRLIAMGVAGNPDLAGALARVRAAQATIGARRADTLPQIAASAKAPRQRYPENYILPPPLGGSTFWVPQIEATLDWDLDLFGRNKAALAQARSNAAATALDAEAARLTLTTAIAQTYVGLAHAERQIAVADGFVQTRGQALSLVETRVKSQLANNIDLQQAQTLLAEAQQAKTRAVEQRDTIVHALAALVGRGPDFYGQITAPTLAFDSPPVVPDVLPADLLGRRPDLLAGQARIDAAMAGRQIAKAEFLPNISIQALAGTLALGLGNAFKPGSTEFGVGPAIHLPIFEGGRLKANYIGATAGIDEAIASYDGAVVKSVRDAADAITHVGAADRDLADQARIVGGLRETVRLNQVRLDTGLGSKLDTIDSGFRLLEAEQALVTLQAQAFTRRIQLIAALGGGFDPNAPRVAATSAVDPQS
nr:efflux transporter outer membrane subunit [Sphingobium nicotianae]